MNNKGFTLLEIIMVVAILGIITLILVPNVISLIKKNNEKEYEILKENIIYASKLYVSENRYNLSINCGEVYDNVTTEITLNDLVNFGSLSEPVIDPRTKKEIDLNSKVIVNYNCNTEKFTYSLDVK